MASSAEINKQIIYYKGLRSSSSTKVSELEDDVDELEELKSKYDDLQDTFEEYQEKRRDALSKLKNVSKIRSFNKYYSGMKELLKGTEFSSADNGLTDAISIIKDKIEDIKDDIDEYDLEISRYDGIIEDLENDYKSALQDEG